MDSGIFYMLCSANSRQCTFHISLHSTYCAPLEELILWLYFFIAARLHKLPSQFEKHSLGNLGE